MDLLRALGVEAELVARQLTVGLLLWARLMPLVALSPWLRFRHAPAALWLALSAVMTFCLWPVAFASAGEPPLTLVALLPLLLRELLVGAVYGLAFALPLLAVGWGGELIDRLRGAQQSAPDEPPPVGQLYAWLAVTIFFVAGGHRLVLESLASSIVTMPVGTITPLAGPLELALGTARLVGDALRTALSLLLPVGLTLLGAELCLSLSLRAAVSLSAVASLAGVRSLLALSVVLLGLPALLQMMPSALAHGVRSASQLLQSM